MKPTRQEFAEYSKQLREFWSDRESEKLKAIQEADADQLASFADDIADAPSELEAVVLHTYAHTIRDDGTDRVHKPILGFLPYYREMPPGSNERTYVKPRTDYWGIYRFALLCADNALAALRGAGGGK